MIFPVKADSLLLTSYSCATRPKPARWDERTEHRHPPGAFALASAGPLHHPADMPQPDRSARRPRTFDDLEQLTHVPYDQLVTEQAEPPPPGPLSAEEFDRQQLLGVTGAGRLHPG